MTTLGANVNRVYELDGYNDIPMIASDIIYKGAAVGDNGSGYARPLVAGDPFLGFAESLVDNSAGSAGDKSVSLVPRGAIVLSITGVTGVGDVGKAVYASDDDTFTLTEGSNSYIGRIYRHGSGTLAIVRFDASRAASVLPTIVNNLVGSTVTVDHRGVLMTCVGPLTVPLQAAATLGEGWFCYFRNTGSGLVTLDPNGSETINGVTTFLLSAGASVLLICTGSGFYTVGYTLPAVIGDFEQYDFDGGACGRVGECEFNDYVEFDGGGYLGQWVVLRCDQFRNRRHYN